MKLKPKSIFFAKSGLMFLTVLLLNTPIVFAQYGLSLQNGSATPTTGTNCGNSQSITLYRNGSTTYSGCPRFRHFLEYKVGSGSWIAVGQWSGTGSGSYPASITVSKTIFSSDLTSWNPSGQTLYFRSRQEMYYTGLSGCIGTTTTTYSNTVTINYISPATITSQPINSSVVEGNNTSFSVTASNATSYQWQVSTDGGSTYNNITAAGSNPVYSGYNTSTLTLTGVVAANNGYKYQCIVTGCNSVTSSQATLTVTSTCLAPNVQASAATFTTLTSTSGTLSWTNGNGTGRVVYINTTNSFTAPTDGSSPTANTAYGGSGQQCVYNGNGNSVTITGLTIGTTYYVRIYEFDCSGILYNASTASNNPTNFSIFECNYPVVQATSFTSNPYSNGMIVGWTNGDGSNRIVFINTTNSFTAPVDGNTYTANAVYSGSGQQCVYNGTGSAVDVSGLNSSTTYYFAVYEFNSSGSCYTSSPLSGNATTTSTASTYIITSIDNGAGYTGTFNGNTNSTIYLCYGSSVCIQTNIPLSLGDYSKRFQTSSDAGVTDPWFTWAGTTYCSPSSGVRYVRGCLWDASLGVMPGSETPWLKIVHGPESVADPTNIATTNITPTSFTANWTSSATVCAGGGLGIIHRIDVATDASFSNMLTGYPKDVTSCITNGPTLCSYDVTGLTTGITYYWRVKAMSYHVGTNNGDLYCGVNSNYVPTSFNLPVELTDFSTKCNVASVTLSWSTATETNNDYFTIEKSINAEDWVPVGIVDGAGNSNELINYEFEDAEPMSGTSYYRLKQTDFDGKFEYFGPVTVNCDEGANGIIAYPNPAQENVLVVGSQDVAAEIYLCDLTGRIITSYSCSRLSEPFSIDLQNILPGIYLIRVDSQNNSEYFRVVKE